ncbi:MAG: nucleoside 2-deoxyribosyltransferase [Firmicutes bacterium]|jgi:nucleoside 2-deoxyribosyltransferase|nr:nucleoside 2-deoxyribosyltransferase [Bacillota bacterium]
MRIYYARPIFTRSEHEFNTKVEKLVDEAGISRQRWGGTKENATRTRAKRVFDNDYAGLEEAQAMLAVLSGTEVDDGTAAEIGIFHALMRADKGKKGIVAVLDDWRTDTENPKFEGRGLSYSILGCLRRSGVIVQTVEDGIEKLREWDRELEASAPTPEASCAVDETGEPARLVYLTGPLYTPYARRHIAECAQALRERGMEVYVPSGRAEARPTLTPEEVFDQDAAALSRAKALVAVMDGAQVDDSVAMEIGIFCVLLRRDPAKKGMLGLMTDSRGLRWRDNEFGTNLFVAGIIHECGRIMDDFDGLAGQLDAWMKEVLT